MRHQPGTACLWIVFGSILFVSTRAFLPTFTAGDYKAAAIEKSDAGDLAGAIEDFRRAIQLDPYDAVGFNNLGVALMRHGVETRNVKELKESYSRFARSMVLKKDKNTKDNMKLVKNYMKSFTRLLEKEKKAAINFKK